MAMRMKTVVTMEQTIMHRQIPILMIIFLFVDRCRKVALGLSKEQIGNRKQIESN